MAGVKWTDNQQDAISARNGTVLVSAAAGSGKTAVLVERVIQIMTDTVSPVDADRLLVVTYTRAAAGEMRERINKRLDEMLAADPFNVHLRRQQMLLAKAQISTIHSFCQSLAKEFFYILDIPADFRIADDTELEILKAAAMNDVIERKYTEGDTDFLKISDMFSTSKSDSALQKLILRLYGFLRSHPFPKRWSDEKCAMYSGAESVSKTHWGGVIRERTKVMVYFAKDIIQRNLKLLGEEPALANHKFGDIIRDDADLIDNVLARTEEGGWDDISKSLELFSRKVTLRAPDKLKDNETKLRIAANRDSVKKIIESLKALYAFSEEQCMADITELAPTVRCMFNVMNEFEEVYSEIKAERKIADYSDLEHWALKLLVKETDNGPVPTDIARLVSSRYDFVMVDEYQDANAIQDTIFKAVSDDDKKLFVVGDVKQSIYRFRQAMPEIFIKRKNRYTLYDRNANRYPSKVILDRNFRSREGITEAVNFVFRNLMSETVGEIAYTDEEKLVFGAKNYSADDAPCVSYHLLSINSTESKNKDQEEAKYIASLITEMMHTQTVTDKKCLRSPTYGDFCILMRSVKNHADAYVDELKACGIPAVCETDESFFDRREIKIILSLLRVIDNPVQDIPLASVLLSPIYGFSEEELAEMRVAHPYGTLYTVLLDAANDNNKKVSEKVKEKAKDFLAKLSKLRKAAASLPTDVLLDRIYTETSLPEIVSAEEEGEYKRKNLRLLLTYAKDYENAGYKGAGGFVRFINKLEENNSDLKCASNGDAAENAVKIMTIHKSKGLEFPICIIAGLTRELNTDTSNEVLLHNELGLGVKRTDKNKMCKYTTMPREAVSMEIKRSELSEELRVLYVALTRAKEKLVLVSGIKAKSKAKGDIESYFEGIIGKLSYDDNAISRYSVSEVKTLGEWIAQCALIHPAHHELRAEFGYTGSFALGSEKPWDIVMINDLKEYYSGLSADTPADKKEDSDEITLSDEEFMLEKQRYADMLKDRLSAVYQHEQLSKIPMKVSASALAHKAVEKRYAALSKPAFMNTEKLTGAARGTAVHAFVQYCNILKARESVQSEIDRLVERGFLTKLQGESVDTEKAERFVNSSLAQRMLDSPMLEREYRFTVEIPASSVDSAIEAPYREERVILQGAIDCMFEENGRMIIVDYKTDKVNDPEKLAEMYKEQLRLYRMAVEQITGKPVEECVLYSFEMSCEVRV